MFSRRAGSGSTLFLVYLLGGLTLWCGSSIALDFETFYASEPVPAVVVDKGYESSTRGGGNRTVTVEFTDDEGRLRTEKFSGGEGLSVGEETEVRIGTLTGAVELFRPAPTGLAAVTLFKALGLAALGWMFVSFWRDYRRERDPEDEPAS
ncbi:hypothetical protein AB0B28_20780 [Glycomyces sp. NPDC046736]|uniref:hypothetical protein n=1 Tax=Glycomyces sp. NPDC046736 TaxID=3155615 RepID=UPI0033C793AE